MTINLRNMIENSQDRWEHLTGQAFQCSILISPYNKRITVYEFSLRLDNGIEEMIQILTEKASEYQLDKIWLKARARWKEKFLRSKMKLEASIPGYYGGVETAMVFAKYLTVRRETPSGLSNKNHAIKPVYNALRGTHSDSAVPHGVIIKQGEAANCRDLASLYSKVFATYPFPIFNSDYLAHTMDQNVYYVLALYNNEIVAAASAEINTLDKNAEVTDFAVLPEWRGRRLASCLLLHMEDVLKNTEIKCLYTIARSSSVGMNKVFANFGYGFGGVLINNCNIGGGFEDMNVWSKVH
ncbi:GCN5-related N-acetyltransferase [Desulfofarcimen acetoxidans DSM 771]|uniref:GCN5-related N-acetyltransferase n=1 Tax=Desulfofarcimen acetoxidans (strain ATCC 49208 / DSM 771 / KCTC 5769 / VKM B-1644 / 5575) TaxID=485916 RepID=C8W666_DESAS|nr:putative beta-lysine N-acetyltransferase [Desulfofarcimen acetoxidans]ACV61521.1 GCN5-related N-acetyltransferase [Desulfofarcimen acetoxidans DSM 771]